ncbi:SMP-30/gluconolactonase/LRE family protein [Vibrio cortegadensis]|uniref:SMP-30/gluconolactonase/LRE family protein n=1 Tax=Vibrio cortegadensis TaxID=1328770 RepID=UPI0021C37CB6|nr:SMP-30/gluconolactonase/LRE family protein [Vibrio cortegadensis]MDN3697500.1 SMP-30/gluconolactonase/LRE family protein [Vibrio cortegadensis]
MKLSVLHSSANTVGESPFWSKNENALYWVDIIGKTVNRLVIEDNKLTTWAFDDLTCGVVPMANGNICVALQHDLLELNQKTGNIEKLFEIEDDLPKNRINEVKCGRNGHLWVGTMQNNVAPDGSGMDITENSGALYIVRSKDDITKMADGFGISNTLVWDEPNKNFYIADSIKDMMWKYDYNPETCEIENPQDFFYQKSILGAPDGSAMDVEGCVWNARFGAGCVVRIGRDGEILEKINLPVTNPTSCCFGGKDNTTLFVTSARFTLSDDTIKQNSTEGAVIAIETGIQGTETFSWKI